jgi:hypothetical protein
MTFPDTSHFCDTKIHFGCVCEATTEENAGHGHIRIGADNCRFPTLSAALVKPDTPTLDQKGADNSP